jgi:peptide-methionine (S)-S-oxide reductase
MLLPLLRRAVAIGGLLALPLALSLALRLVPQAGRADTLPPPRQDHPHRDSAQRIAVFAGGCFWGMEAVFEHINGVIDVQTGYAGGDPQTASYDSVSSGLTGHAEGIHITYDPSKVSYGQLLRVFFAVAHDPTQLNRQGPDVGTQYRSAIFTTDPAERDVAQAYIQQLEQDGSFDAAIVTRLEPSDTFYRAEPFHQDFVKRNPAHPYVVVHDLPKLEALRRKLPELVR